ncbi:MAG: transporter substrate-binding domain-containing protein [Desulfobacteraceae bacterium]|nr:transporter substrate-binding domain-containing protein [Desulfobacteraceae bacterium]
MIRKTTLTLGSLICSVFFLTMYSLATADAVPKFTIYTENYKPYNFEKDGKIQGIAVELLTQMLEKAGSSQTLADIKLVPWARGYDAVQKNEKTLLFSITRTEEREDLFKWVCPIKTITEELWALKPIFVGRQHNILKTLIAK